MLYRPVKIGALELGGNLFLAPVAGYSDRSFRSICVEHGASFTCTEMVSAEALVRNNQKTEGLMRRAPNETAYCVQIFGGEPEIIAAAVEIVLRKTGCECIDINCGCPVPKIVKTGAGSALTRDPDRLFRVATAAVRAAGNVPVTVKIRSGWDDAHITWKEAALAAADAGCAAVTLHARTRAQGYEGNADRRQLKALSELLRGRAAVFGSGDLFTPEDARDMLAETGCDGVMFARGAMGNPFIFKKTIRLLTEGSYAEISQEERIEAGFTELERLAADIGEKPACLEMRKRFCAYSKGMRGGSALRKKIVHAESLADYRALFCST